METLASPLVLTKLRVPAARPRTVQRARLLDLLGGDPTGLTVVCAPAGYGKTTLLADWAREHMQHGMAVAWYALEKSDDSPNLFASYLIASLLQALGPLPGLVQTAQMLRGSPEMNLLHILPTVINTLVASQRPCALVLDDFHLITSLIIHGAVTYLIDHLPENLRVVIGSRANLPMHLARWRASGQLIEVRAAHLRFHEDEAAQFLRSSMRLELSTETISALVEHTEGWAAGLQLAALTMQGSPSAQPDALPQVSGWQLYLIEYLMEEVVNRLPEDAQRFLLYTSILERMTAPLCDALVEGASSAAILEQLEQANLFVIPLNDPGQWFRYHHLFGDFLRAHLKQVQPERIPALHRAACAWLAANNLLREAAYHAFQTRDWEFAAAFVEQHGFKMLILSEIATLYEWCSAFPEEVMRRHPTLGLLQCWTWVFSFRRDNRERVEKRLRQAERAITAIKDPELSSGLTEHAQTIRAYMVMAPDPNADARAYLAHAKKMLHAAPKDVGTSRFGALLAVGYAHMALHDARAAEGVLQEAYQVAAEEGLFFGMIESTFHRARMAHVQGHLHRALEICREMREMLEAAQPGLDLPALSSLEITEGSVLLDLNQLDAAEQQLTRGLDRIGWGMNPHYRFTGSAALFRLYELQGRSAEAMQILDSLEAAWPDIAFCTRGLRAVHVLRIGTAWPVSAWIIGWLRAFQPDQISLPGMGPFGAAELYYLAAFAWMRVQIATGNIKAARPLLARLLERAEENGLATRVTELSQLEAEAARVESEQHPSNCPLSERELEVLRLIARGASNQEIADRLVITLGTVKSHMNHILTKLDARSRTEAVAKAREMGWL